MTRLPSVELVGKNANNRDVSIRFDIDHMPVDDEQWLAAAHERGLAVDESKTRGNIIVGQHNGFGGFLKSYDTLQDAVAAREVVLTADLIHPEYKDAYNRFLRQQGLTAQEVDFQCDSVGPEDSYYQIALQRGLLVGGEHPLSQVLNARTDWEQVLQEVKEPHEEYVRTKSGVWYFSYKK